MKKITQPYELLVRWRDGKISGAHIERIQTVVDDNGTVISTTVLPVEAINPTAKELAALFKPEHLDALAAHAQLLQLQTELTQTKLALEISEANNKQKEKTDMKTLTMKFERQPADPAGSKEQAQHVTFVAADGQNSTLNLTPEEAGTATLIQAVITELE